MRVEALVAGHAVASGARRSLLLFNRTLLVAVHRSHLRQWPMCAGICNSSVAYVLVLAASSMLLVCTITTAVAYVMTDKSAAWVAYCEHVLGP